IILEIFFKVNILNMNSSYVNTISSTRIPFSTTEFLDKGYWDTIESQSIRIVKSWARDVLISLTFVVILITIIVSVSCIRAYIKSRNDALIHDPEERWIKSMCLDSKIPLIDHNLYENQKNMVIVKVNENDDIEDLINNIEKIDCNHRNGTVFELTTDEEQ
uniref:Nematode cuticle collagen N-terminal domain-containing protein n=1 Tax=Strongyloides stercoralis TaxID=6248 RepID=A0AAF5CWS9_STRER